MSYTSINGTECPNGTNMDRTVSRDQFWTITTARRVGKSLQIKGESTQLQMFYVDALKDRKKKFPPKKDDNVIWRKPEIETPCRLVEQFKAHRHDCSFCQEKSNLNGRVLYNGFQTQGDHHSFVFIG